MLNDVRLKGKRMKVSGWFVGRTINHENERRLEKIGAELNKQDRLD